MSLIIEFAILCAFTAYNLKRREGPGPGPEKSLLRRQYK